MHRTEPSRLQSLSLQLSDKIAQMVDNNERLLEFRGYQGGGGGGWRGRDRGGGILHRPRTRLGSPGHKLISRRPLISLGAQTSETDFHCWSLIHVCHTLLDFCTIVRTAAASKWHEG